MIDSQSVKTVYASDECGFNGGKKTKGRKCHIVTDTMGNLQTVAVYAANIHDTKFGLVPAMQAYENYPTIERFCGDEVYRKTFENEVSEELGLGVDISKRIDPQFAVIPKRGVVERTLSCLGNSRRLSKDYEIRTYYFEAIIQISHLHSLIKRL